MSTAPPDIHELGQSWRSAVHGSAASMTLVSLYSSVVFVACGTLEALRTPDVEAMHAFDLQGWATHVGDSYVTSILAQCTDIIIVLDVRIGNDAVTRYTFASPDGPPHAQDLYVTLASVHVHVALPQSLLSSIMECVRDEADHVSGIRVWYVELESIAAAVGESVDVHPIAADDPHLSVYADTDIARRIAALSEEQMLLWIHVSSEGRHEFITLSA